MISHTKSHAFSTTTRVYPGYLPYLHNMRNARSRSLSWIPPLVAVAAAGYGAAAYREAQLERHVAAVAAAEQEEAERKRRSEALMDAYGDRSSLNALERAMTVYESHREQK